jgi:type VI secretion system protein ImpA
MISASELLQPVSPDHPCGEDLSYDPGFQELESLMRGKEETQFSAAEEPDWRALRERCLELWPRSRDLRLATVLSLALLKTDGLPGFREALTVLKGLIDQYWESLYPQLDPADNNDPTQRVNIVAALAAPAGTYGDPMRLIERLRETPLTHSVQMGHHGLADILRSETGEAAAEGQPPPPSAAQIEAAFRDTKPDDLVALHRAAADAAALVRDIDASLTRTLGPGKAPDLELLPKELGEIQQRLAPYLPAAAAPTAPGAPGAPAASPGPGEVPRPAGAIASNQDVVRLLDTICEFYARSEPSSPVPNLLRRARRLAQMDFLQIIEDLAPDALQGVRHITGDKPKEPEGG